MKLEEKLQNVATPSYVMDEKKLRENLEVLKMVQDRTGCHILLAQKAFSMFYFYPMIGKYLKGATASGIFEAKLAHEFMKDKENHIFSPAYKEKDFAEIVEICDHIIFNSFNQWEKYKDIALDENNKEEIIKPLLIINTFIKKNPYEREEVDETTIKKAEEKYGTLIITSLNFLELYEKFKNNEITTGEIKNRFKDEVGLFKP